AWLRSIDARPIHRGWYALSLILFALSLLSKVWGITFPLILLILDMYPLRRTMAASWRSLALEKLPFAILALAAAAMALSAQTTNIGSIANAGPAGRCAQAAFGLVYYLTKIIWPFPLSPIYEHPLPFNPCAPAFIVADAAVMFITLGLWLVRKAWPAGLTCWAIYVVVLSPVLGFVQVGPQISADRYTFLAAAPVAH